MPITTPAAYAAQPMKKALFAGLLESVQEMDQIARGERAPGRVWRVDGAGRTEVPAEQFRRQAQGRPRTARKAR